MPQHQQDYSRTEKYWRQADWEQGPLAKAAFSSLVSAPDGICECHGQPQEQREFYRDVNTVVELEIYIITPLSE
jgi:hypothetical protein